MQDRKKELQLAIASIVKNNRKKSITKSAEEIGIGKSIWADLENGGKDPQMTTFWRIAEALELKPSQLLKEVEEYLGNDFSFLENTSAKK
ncbi:MAG: helix-turn-helix transcriptional regulator [Candidatus Gastranaerophilales bacterium]